MIFEEVKEIIVETMGVSTEEVKMESDLVDDLGADSIDAVELSISIEEAFDLDISDDAVTRFKTVADIVSYIEREKGE